MIDLQELRDSASTPWNAGRWNKNIVSVDGAPVTIPHPSEVSAVVAYHDCGWDEGMHVAVIKLCDGRFMAWENRVGVTGSGFSEDAYGGDAEVWVAWTHDDAVAFMSDQCFELIEDEFLRW